MSTISKFAGRVVCTKAQFDALAEKDPNKEYLVTDDDTSGGEKLYLHKVTINDSAVTKLIRLLFVNSNSNKITNITQNLVNTAIKCYASPTIPPAYYECTFLPISVADGNIEVNGFTSYPFNISNTTSVNIELATATIEDHVYEL